MTARVVVLASGSGTNLQSLIDACAQGRLDAEVVHVVSDRADAFALERARRSEISSECRPPAPLLGDSADRGAARRSYDTELARSVADRHPDLVVLAGWMRLLTSEFLGTFPDQVINLHPALPGKFPGAHAIDDAWEAHQTAGLDHTGVMVHMVPDEGIDNGPVVATQRVDILDTDTRASLEERIHEVEHELLTRAVSELIAGNE